MWKPVKRSTHISFDLETTSLLVKTDSAAGSEETIWVLLRNAQDELIAGVVVKFSSPIKYSIGGCKPDLTDLPTQPPDDVDKIWTFKKTSTALIISCNGVEVLN